MYDYDLIVIGGGPAGLAAAISAYENGIRRMLILERDRELGGILNQCIHNGFGLHTFKEELTGPEYAARYVRRVYELGIEIWTDTMVLDISTDKTVTAVNRKRGIVRLSAKTVILAMGCRERPRGALGIPGFRPAGIYTAGTAQRLVNMDGVMPGREVVILGSGDIGLIMARRLTLEGALVKVVAELLPYSGGLKRNIVQCLDDYGIPLQLSHTVVDIRGRKRVEGVTIAEVDDKLKPVPGTEKDYACDTLLLSVGLIPENELSKSAGVELSRATKGPVVDESLETSVQGIFACGNVLHVHDLVDNVSEEAAYAGRSAARYAAGVSAGARSQKVAIKAGPHVRYTVPSFVDPERADEALTIRFRVTDVLTNCSVKVLFDGVPVKTYKKRVAAPGEMEEVKIIREAFLAYPGLAEITVMIETEA